MESLKTYRGTEGEHHCVLEGVVWDRQELLDFYKQFDESCHYWNEFKKKYIKNSIIKHLLINLDKYMHLTLKAKNLLNIQYKSLLNSLI